MYSRELISVTVSVPKESSTLERIPLIKVYLTARAHFGKTSIVPIDENPRLNRLPRLES